MRYILHQFKLKPNTVCKHLTEISCCRIFIIYHWLYCLKIVYRLPCLAYYVHFRLMSICVSLWAVFIRLETEEHIGPVCIQHTARRECFIRIFWNEFVSAEILWDTIEDNIIIATFSLWLSIKHCACCGFGFVQRTGEIEITEKEIDNIQNRNNSSVFNTWLMTSLFFIIHNNLRIFE